LEHLGRTVEEWQAWWQSLARLCANHPVDSDNAHTLALGSLTVLLDTAQPPLPSPEAPWKHRLECAICLEAAESTEHLFLRCRLLPVIWSLISDTPCLPSRSDNWSAPPVSLLWIE
jgi:hypothetical protein